MVWLHSNRMEAVKKSHIFIFSQQREAEEKNCNEKKSYKFFGWIQNEFLPSHSIVCDEFRLAKEEERKNIEPP